MKLDTSILTKALLKLEALYTFNQITQETKVYNLKKMVDGKTTPTPESWWKLHNAYPDDIPEPQYIDGSRVYKNIVNGNETRTDSHNADTLTINNESQRDKDKLSPEEWTLIRAIRKTEDPESLIMKLIIEVVNG